MLPFTFGDEPYEKGQSVSTQCSVSSGDLPINISWQFNNRPLTNKDVNISPIGKRASAISIDQVSWEHVGNYTCVGENRAGRASFSAELFVNGLFSKTSFLQLLFRMYFLFLSINQ